MDAPLGVKAPWASGLEMAIGNVTSQKGPHQEGYFSDGF